MNTDLLISITAFLVLTLLWLGFGAALPLNRELLDKAWCLFRSWNILLQLSELELHAPDDTLVSFKQAEFTARNIRGTQFIPMEKGDHLALMLKSNTSAKKYVLNFLHRYNNPELTGLPTMKIKGDLVCGN